MQSLGISVSEPKDHGMSTINQVHDLGYLRFLESAHRRWKSQPEDWGDEVMSNVFVRSPNPMKGILAESAHYQADGSCPIGPHTWEAAYWSAQSALSAADELLAGEQRAYAISRPWASRPPGCGRRFLLPEQRSHCGGITALTLFPRRHPGPGHAPWPGRPGDFLRTR